MGCHFLSEIRAEGEEIIENGGKIQYIAIE